MRQVWRDFRFAAKEPVVFYELLKGALAVPIDLAITGDDLTTRKVMDTIKDTIWRLYPQKKKGNIKKYKRIVENGSKALHRYWQEWGLKKNPPPPGHDLKETHFAFPRGKDALPILYEEKNRKAIGAFHLLSYDPELNSLFRRLIQLDENGGWGEKKRARKEFLDRAWTLLHSPEAERIIAAPLLLPLLDFARVLLLLQQGGSPAELKQTSLAVLSPKPLTVGPEIQNRIR